MADYKKLINEGQSSFADLIEFISNIPKRGAKKVGRAVKGSLAGDAITEVRSILDAIQSETGYAERSPWDKAGDLIGGIQKVDNAPGVDPTTALAGDIGENALLSMIAEQQKRSNQQPSGKSTPQVTPQDAPRKSTPQDPEYMKGRTKAGEINGKPVPEARVDQVLNARYQVQKANAAHQQKLAELEMMRTQRAMQQDMIQENVRQQTEMKMAEARQESAAVMDILQKQGLMNEAMIAQPYAQAQQKAAQEQAIVMDMAAKQDQLAGMYAAAQAPNEKVQAARVKAQGDFAVAQTKAEADKYVAEMKNSFDMNKMSKAEAKEVNTTLRGIVKDAYNLKLPVPSRGGIDPPKDMPVSTIASDPNQPWSLRFKAMETPAIDIAKNYTAKDPEKFDEAASALVQAMRIYSSDTRFEGISAEEFINESLTELLQDYEINEVDLGMLKEMARAYKYNARKTDERRQPVK